jgi:hypothetical protein
MTEKSIAPQSWMLPITTDVWKTDSIVLANYLWGFLPISLQQMDGAALLNRVDTKFVVPVKNLIDTIPSLYPYYRILVVEGRRMSHYRTLYFDTSDFALYTMQVNGKNDRYKVRSREYIDSSEAFLEVKHKTPKDRTIKSRIPTSKPVIQMNPQAEHWLEKVYPYDSRDLEPKLWNMFTRITLVNRQYCERVTIDVDLSFYAPFNVVQLDGIAVAEVKMDGLHSKSPFLEMMRAQRMQPQGFSKYCIGTSLLYDQVKKNAMKPKILWLEKMIKGVMYE